MRPSACAVIVSTARCLACGLALAGSAPARSSPNADCQLALASATALADRFAQGDPSLGDQDAADLAWVAMPEYQQTLALRGCAQMSPQFEAVALAGLRSGKIDVRALLRQACSAGTEPLDDNARAAREAMREQGMAGLRMLGDDARACVAPTTPATGRGTR